MSQYVSMPDTGTVHTGICMVQENLTHELPILNPKNDPLEKVSGQKYLQFLGHQQ